MTRLIDVDVLMEWFNNHYDHEEFTVGYIIGIIREQPIVGTVPVRHGKWIPVGEIDRDGNQYYKCSVCQCGETHCPNVEVPFCWRCGAMMEENDENR